MATKTIVCFVAFVILVRFCVEICLKKVMSSASVCPKGGMEKGRGLVVLGAFPVLLAEFAKRDRPFKIQPKIQSISQQSRR